MVLGTVGTRYDNQWFMVKGRFKVYLKSMTYRRSIERLLYKHFKQDLNEKEGLRASNNNNRGQFLSRYKSDFFIN